MDGDWKGTHFIGYNEFDFLGTSGASNINTTNGAVVPRIRLYWVDARHGGWEFLAGQSWSMLTPNRRGISPLPGDIFYSQVMDVNYMAGLTWTRQPGFRVLYHFGDTLTWGLSAEEPDQYIGGSSGGSTIVLPSALTALAGTQLDNATYSNPFNGPQLTPDFISKIAWDPGSRFHAEVGGVVSTFKIVNPNNLALGVTNTKAGGGVLVGMNGEIFKGFRLITTNFWSDGDGRYLFGTAPDVVVNANGTMSLLHSGGTVDGFESRIGSKLLLFMYYGGIYIGRDVVIDTTGKLVGYGYTGSANSQNRAIQEGTPWFQPDHVGQPALWCNQSDRSIRVYDQGTVVRHQSKSSSRQQRLLRRPVYSSGQHASVLKRQILSREGVAHKPPPTRKKDSIHDETNFLDSSFHGRGGHGSAGGDHQRRGSHLPRAHLSKVV